MTKVEKKSLNYYPERKSTVKECKRLSWTKDRRAERKKSFIKEEGLLGAGKHRDTLILGSRRPQSGPAGVYSSAGKPLSTFILSDPELGRPQEEFQKHHLICTNHLHLPLRTLELSTLHIDLIAGKFHSVSPPAEVNTTLEYRSPGDRKKEKGL